MTNAKPQKRKEMFIRNYRSVSKLGH